jgi:outer membrane scaffolding protein for murein synthesis (MipA/OmpV family)
MVAATKSRAVLLCSAALVVCISRGTAARAEDPETSPQGEAPAMAEGRGWNGYLAAGAIGVPDYEGSKDYQAAPLIGARLGYDTYYLEIQGLGLRANLSPFSRWEFGPSVGLRSGRDDVENDRVDALRDIDDTVEVGAFITVSVYELVHPSDELAFGVDVKTGLSDDGKGTTVSLGPTYSFSPLERLRLGLGISATFADGDYVDTYFGIDGGDALRSGLSPYDADGGLKDIGISLNASYQLSEHWGVMGFAGYTQLVGDAADSPIVDDEGSAGQGMIGVGIAYRF